MTPDSSLRLPEGARLVHIGPHKTGSTAVQVALHEARDACERHGVHYAGAGVRPRKAGWSIGLMGRPSGTEPPPEEHWHRLVEEVATSTATRVCVSNEDFGRADAAQRHRIVTDLGGPAVHVVAAVRRLDRYLPSQWQERVKAGETRSWEDWLRVVLDRDDPEPSWDRTNVWRAHDTGQLVAGWLDEVPPERFHLLVSEEGDRRSMPDAFEDLLDLPRGTLQLFPDRSNRSLSWSEAELVRAVSVGLLERGRGASERRVLLRSSVVGTLVRGAGSAVGPRVPPFPEWALDRVRDISRERVQAIRASGVRVHGDPATMLVPDDVRPGDAARLPDVDAGTAASAVLSVVDAAGWHPDATVGAPPAPAPDRPGPAPRVTVDRLAGRVVRRVSRRVRAIGGRG